MLFHKKRFAIVSLTICIMCLLGIVGCSKKTFDINVDPNNPTSLPVNILLTGIENKMADVPSNASSILEIWMHRIVIRESSNGYQNTPSDVSILTAWRAAYRDVFTNANILIQNATADGNLKYAGIAKIIKAYTASQLVDVFGDVPYSEANQLLGLIKNPLFDNQKNIYDSALALLDNGISDLNASATNALVPGSDDVIYSGNVSRWIKAANTIKLKLYAQLRRFPEQAADAASKANALIAGGNIIGAHADDFLIKYDATTKNPRYGEYSATQRTQYISPWFYEILKGYNQNIFKGNPDPRVPYYFFNQVPNGKTTTNDVSATEYRDGSFVSIYFGSNGVNAGFSQQNSLTMEGIYSVGGRYDDGLGNSAGNITISSGTGTAPMKLITYVDRLYLEAELINTGVTPTGDARAKLQSAIYESFRQVDYVISTYVKPTSQTVPTFFTGSDTAETVKTYVNNVMREYDLGNTEKKLQIIMTQKWIASFGTAVDAYTDYRRTGYPIIFDPRNPAMAPGGFVQPPINGNPLVNPQAPVPVQQIVDYPISFYWPQAELDANNKAPKEKTPSAYKIFWMP